MTNAGYCPCCRQDTTFVAHDSWLRDSYLCTQCLSIPRQRHIQAVLDDEFPGWERKTIHESSPSNDFIARYAEDYSFSHYLPDVARGESLDGVRSESIEQLTFDDESIDLFITQDVLEHVFDPARAIAEVDRVLRPGGAHVFTTPKHRNLMASVQRAKLEDGGVVHLLEEAYHGNPIGDHKALVTWDYGADFEDMLSEWSGKTVEAVHTVDPSRGLVADHNEVFIIRKPHPARIEEPPPGGLRAAIRQMKSPTRELVKESGRFARRRAIRAREAARKALPVRGSRR